jgi:hypothetical protein
MRGEAESEIRERQRGQADDREKCNWELIQVAGLAAAAPCCTKPAAKQRRGVHACSDGAHLFLRMGVRRGSRSLMGGVMRVMPITFTMPFSAPRIEPSTSAQGEAKGQAKARWGGASE